MPEFLQFGFMQRAFAAGVVMAVVCPLIGVFLVPRRLSLIADTLAHVALAGVAVGLLVGSSPILGALVVTVVGALGMERLRSHGRLQGDATVPPVMQRRAPRPHDENCRQFWEADASVRRVR